MKHSENRRAPAHRLYAGILIFLTLLGIFVPVIFTAVQMGVFSKEPVLETEAMTTDPSAPVFRVAADYDFCPNAYINQKGELSGLYIEIMTEAAQLATEYAREQSDARIADKVAVIEDSGTQIIKLSDETRKEIREASQGVYDSIREKINPDIYNSYMDGIE